MKDEGLGVGLIGFGTIGTGVATVLRRNADVIGARLGSPLVVTAWARQLRLDSVDDPRLVQFIETYRNSDNAPEPSAACQGVGEPAVASPTA